MPGDISVVGFDNTTIAQLDFVGLSTIDYARQEMGQRTLELLNSRITDPAQPARTMILTPTLITRTTTGPAQTR